eukprot:m51a1_g1059 putative dna replication complex gins protein psf1 (189) ;mRNA; r:817826-818713
MQSRTATELLREAKRSGAALAPYDQDAVNHVVSDMRALHERVAADINDAALLPLNIAHQVALFHDKRCVLAYLRHRMALLREARWQLGSVLPEELRERLSPDECEMYSRYSRALADYMVSVGLDLNTDVSRPPSEACVEVRGTRADQAETQVFTDSGPISLDPGTVQFVRLDPTVESLIRQGLLEHVS